MKHIGSTSEYAKERVRDLLRAYDQHVTTVSHLYMPDVYSTVSNMPSRRFWVSNSRAYNVISAMERGKPVLDKMRPSKREMYTEIHRRVKKQQQQHPSSDLFSICADVVAQPAPKFYLAPGSAKQMICKARKQWHKEKLKKLRLWR